MHNSDDMKENDDRPATKGDLDRLTAMIGLDRFATKIDLDRFATKDDLERSAAESSARMDRMDERFDGMDRRFDEMAAVVRRQSTEIVKTQASVDGLREDVLSVIKGMESRLTGRMDAFMSNTMRVDRDNILLIHRMDKVEGRVSDLERRAP
ncbi:MAG TPA: hypothetical protein DD648_05155 [Candidatus Omnitrophica bacterium]|nr:MAG: hypothetical protein A2040_03680 [Rhodocyclales bacterium GWA2_65_19]HBO97401.1 hypothetical protein [Candidatus Omnitrophota bacterium]